MLRNTPERYGLVTIALHWLVALAVFGLFGLGLWMTGLDYYDPWYKRAPDLHKSIGALLCAVMIMRLVWHIANPRPRPEPTLTTFERTASSLTHALLYGLLFAVMAAGYLISTADGRPLEVFGLCAIPATLVGLPDQADLAGDIHLAFGHRRHRALRGTRPWGAEAPLHRPRQDLAAHARARRADIKDLSHSQTRGPRNAN
jgi:cytochrome b561